MINNIKRTLKHTSIYGTGAIASKLIGIILLPLYTKHISLHDFGVFGMFEIILQLLPIIGLGLPVALQRWLGLKEYFSKRGKILFTCLVFYILYPLILFPIFIFLATNFSQLLFSENHDIVFYVIFVSVYFQLLSKISTILLRMDERSVYFTISNILKITVQLSTIVYFITIKNLGFISIFYGELISTIFLFLATIPYLIKNLKFGFEWNELKSMIRLGIPTISHGYARQLISFTNRYFLVFLISEASLGIYVIGYKIANVIWTFLVTSFNIALPALAWSKVGTENQNRFFSKILTYFTFILVWASLLLSSYSKGIIHYFAQNVSFWSASKIVPVLALGFIFSGINTVLNFGLVASKKTIKMPIILIFSLCINIVSNILIVSYLDYIGTAVVLLLTSISQVTLTYLFSKNHFKVDWEFGKILLMIVVVILLYFATTIFDDYTLLLRIIYKGFIILAFPFILYFFNFYEQIEIETIKKIFKKYLFFSKV